MIKVRKLVWDDWNEEHILRHGVNREEVEDVCFSKHLNFKSGLSKQAVWGQTSAGRYIIIILGVRNYGIFYPVTARIMDEREKRQYKKWQRR